MSPAVWWREVRYEVRLFVRHPAAVAAVLLLPVVLLVLLHSLYSDITVPLSRLRDVGPAEAGATGLLAQRVAFDWYLTPALAAFGVTAACYATLGLRLSVARDRGIPKQARLAPVAPATYVGGWIGLGVFVGMLVGSVTALAGWAFYDVGPPSRGVPVAVLVTGLLSACFCALGVATASVVRSAQNAPAVVLGVLLPLAVLSNVFYVPGQAPAWFDTVGRLLPLEPARAAMTAAFNGVSGSGARLEDIIPLVVWSIVGAVVSVRAWSWIPSA